MKSGYVLLLIAAGALAQPAARFTVRDSIGMTRFGAVEPSPDGRNFFVIAQRGVLPANELESTILLVDGQTAAVRTLVKMASTSNADAITGAQWLSDGQNIAFVGRRGNSGGRLFVVRAKDGALRQLSTAERDVMGFDDAGTTMVYTTVAPYSIEDVYRSVGTGVNDVQAGTGRSIFGFLYPNWEWVNSRELEREFWVTRDLTAPRKIESASFRSRTGILVASPDGRYALLSRKIPFVPQAWQAFLPAYDRESARMALTELDGASLPRQRIEQYMVADLESGVTKPLIDAPIGQLAGYPDPLLNAWSPDRKEIAVSNAYLPVEQAKSAKQLRPCVAVVTIESGKVDCVKMSGAVDFEEASRAPRVAGLSWTADGLTIDYSAGKPRETYRRENGAWQRGADAPRAAKAARNAEWTISVREDLNQPPLLIATNSAGTVKEISTPNAELLRKELGQAKVYHWKDKAGREWTGGLVTPPDYVAGRRYPLVVQTHGFPAKQFLAEGYASTVNAARPMAARGMVVLQVGETRTDAFLTPREPAENGCDGYLAAIDKLASEGVIDPQKVGLIGFSRTGWYVLTCLIAAPNKFAAATLAEATYLSMGEYLLNADYQGRQRAQSLADGIGVEPWGEGVQQWLKMSPGFQTQKITAPVMFETNSPPGLIYAWDIYASMRLQSKPVDFLNIRTGEHVLKRPSHKLASQEMTADWYAFWLKGDEDPDPAKRDQYVRWRLLREQTQARN